MSETLTETTQSSSTVKNLLRNVVLLGISLSVSLLLTEVGLRWALPNLDDGLYSTNHLWNHINDPNYPESLSFFNTRYSYDKVLGYQSPLVLEVLKKERHEPADAKVVFLGDSVTEVGYFLPKVEEIVAQSFEGKNIKLLNAGVVGYNTSQELDLLKLYILDIEPDVVVLQLHYNDMLTTPLFMKTDSGWVGLERESTKWINPSLYQASYLYRLLVVSGLSITNTKPHVALQSSVQQPLSEIHTLLSEKNIDLLVTFFPDFAKERVLADETSLAADPLYQIISSEGLEDNWINLLPLFAKTDLDLVKLDGDHPNKVGGELGGEEIGKRLVEVLQRRGLPVSVIDQ